MYVYIYIYICKHISIDTHFVIVSLSMTFCPSLPQVFGHFCSGHERNHRPTVHCNFGISRLAGTCNFVQTSAALLSIYLNMYISAQIIARTAEATSQVAGISEVRP